LIVRPKNQPNYHLTLTVTGLSAANADALMGLALTINGATLSQSLPFHVRSTSYAYP